jgi:hypothetical protein
VGNSGGSLVFLGDAARVRRAPEECVGANVKRLTDCLAFATARSDSCAGLLEVDVPRVRHGHRGRKRVRHCVSDVVGNATFVLARPL